MTKRATSTNPMLEAALTENEELLAASLASPALDPSFAARVQAIARAELASAERSAGAPETLRLAASGAIVQILLGSAAVSSAAETVAVVTTLGDDAEAPR